MALPYEDVRPTTVNIALNLRTTVTLRPFKKGRVRVCSEGFRHTEEFDAFAPGLKGTFVLFAAAARYTGVHGVEIAIKSEAPVRSAMGGSSTALVACLCALAKATADAGSRSMTKKQILHVAYHLEDAVSGGGCGMQDQAAAVYGGVNQWLWWYSNTNMLFHRNSLADRRRIKELNDRLLVAYSGKTHSSIRINRKWLADFHSGKTTKGWIEANQKVSNFAHSLHVGDWKGCARWLREEMAIRREITPEALIPETSVLIWQAEEAGCGARFAGAGAGGVVWAIGPRQRIDSLRKAWEQTMAGIKGGRLLECAVDPKGVC